MSTIILDDNFGSLDLRSAISILYNLCGSSGFLREERRTVLLSTYMGKRTLDSTFT